MTMKYEQAHSSMMNRRTAKFTYILSNDEAKETLAIVEVVVTAVVFDAGGLVVVARMALERVRSLIEGASIVAALGILQDRTDLCRAAALALQSSDGPARLSSRK
jgi:hypothetical protein